MMKFKIEKNIPVPTLGPIFPFKEMVASDSFFVPTKDAGSKGKRIRKAISNYRKKYPKHTFTIRKANLGYRCWRLT